MASSVPDGELIGIKFGLASHHEIVSRQLSSSGTCFICVMLFTVLLVR